MNRRNFLTTSALALPGLRLRAQTAAAPILLSLPEVANGPTMPDDFVGLSYELQQLTDPAFFSSANTGLIAQFRALSSHGVLRLGGNTSEFADWTPRPGAPEPVHPAIRESEGEPKAQFYPVTPKAVENLGDFLRATGWTCLYGINLGTNTPERAADEAAFVARTLGSRLQYFQIGNEVDLFSRHLRDPKTWSVKAYLDEWLKMARAIEAKVPGAKFGMPDVASDVSWLTRIAELWPSVTNPPAVTTLSHHHYFGGPATNPEVNIPNLLSAKAAAKVRQTALQADAAARTMKARVRMTEGNTCYRGGKPGVSDVFAAALWSANYALLLATNNYSGVNLHGGTGKSVANSVGGFLPGDVMLAEEGKTPAEIAAHPHPFYTPIGTFGDRYELEPVAYGLRFAGAFSGGRLFETDFAPALAASGVNATVYAAMLPGGARSFIVLNRDAEKDLPLTLDFNSGGERLQMEAMTAASLSSRTVQVTSSVSAAKGRRLGVVVPRASAMRVTLGGSATA